MKHKKIISIKKFSLLILLLAPLQSVAASEQSMAVSLAAKDFDYEETDTDGAFLDGEKGTIPGFAANYSRVLTSGLLTRYSFEYFQGVVDYDGHLQSVDQFDPNIHMFPFKTETEETVFTLRVHLSKPLSKSAPLALYGSFSYNNWERDIQGRYVSERGNLGIPINLYIPNLYEEYSWWQLTAGCRARLDIATSSHMEFYAGISRTLDPTMELGPFELDLKEKTGYEAGASWFYEIEPHKRIGIESSISYWEFGRSNPVPIGSDRYILEPDSESKMITFKLTYEWDLLKP